MKKALVVVLLASIAALVSVIMRPDESVAVQQVHAEVRVAITAVRALLDHPQQAWLGSLEYCESRGKPDAINPMDSDGTPSYGILQFKPSTYAWYAKIYGMASTTNYMDPEEQEAIVTQMIIRGVNWAKQFPDCTKKLGVPPKSQVIPTQSIDKK